jgi:hypothetical protein
VNIKLRLPVALDAKKQKTIRLEFRVHQASACFGVLAVERAS